MSVRIYWFVFAVVGLLLAGCATYPMGLSEIQWKTLSPEQQAEYQAKQYAINQERARQFAAEQAQRRQEQEEA